MPKKRKTQKGGYPVKNYSMIQKHIPSLYFMTTKGPKGSKLRNAVIDHIQKPQLNAVKHLVNNFLKKRIRVDNKTLKRLKRDKKYLYGLVSNNHSAKQKKTILKQRGGILAPLIGALAPLVIKPIIGAIAKKKRR